MGIGPFRWLDLSNKRNIFKWHAQKGPNLLQERFKKDRFYLNYFLLNGCNEEGVFR